MILKQYYLGCLAHASYLIGDEESGRAAVVDPQRDIDVYVADADACHLSIDHVFLTHFHADFLAGHLELRDRTGAGIKLGAKASAEYAFEGVADGDDVDLGPQERIRVLETPGHSPESISVLVFDLQADASSPHAVLTGDTLFIGDVGRPDLRASLGWTAEELGGMLYESVQKKLMALPDSTLVYPTHGAGSLCGKHLSEETVSTIGVQRQYNYALQPMTKQQFIDIVTADQPDAPDYFTYDAILNTKEHPTLDTTLRENLNPLSVDDVLALTGDGAQLLDVREPADFAGAHFRNSLNIGLQGKYATWAGTLLDASRQIALVAEPGREEEAAIRLGRIGFDQIAGFLNRAMESLEEHPELVARTERVTAATLCERLSAPSPPVLVDVRAEREWEEVHIEGSINIPLNKLSERYVELGERPEVVVHCASGYRSSVAASLLARIDDIDSSDLVGGIDAWQAAQLPVVGSGA